MLVFFAYGNSGWGNVFIRLMCYRKIILGRDMV